MHTHVHVYILYTYYRQKIRLCICSLQWYTCMCIYSAVINCVRLLTRLIPYLFESNDWRQLFWTPAQIAEVKLFFFIYLLVYCCVYFLVFWASTCSCTSLTWLLDSEIHMFTYMYIVHALCFIIVLFISVINSHLVIYIYNVQCCHMCTVFV